MAGPADRDAAIRTLLTVQTAAIESFSDRADANEKATTSLEGKVDKNTHAVEQLKAAFTEWHADQKLTLWNVLLRSMDRAASSDPLKVLVILSTSLIIAMFILLGGAYSLIWHENPATVIRELETLVPFFGASKP